MRVCSKCAVEKPLEAFERTGHKDGRRRECRDCRSAYYKDWADRSRDQIRAYRRQYHEAHRGEIIARVNDWVAKNPDRRRKNALAYYYRLQDAAILAYGGYVCACCGESEPAFLSIDHVNNDGAKHRKELGSLGGHKFYKWLRDNGYPDGFQVLCMNCNHGRHRNGGICPHQTTKEGVTTTRKG